MQVVLCSYARGGKIMEAFFVVVLAKLIDPLGAVLAGLGTLLFARKWYHVPLIGLVCSLIVETFLASREGMGTWGVGVLPGFTALFALSAFVYLLMKLHGSNTTVHEDDAS